MKQLTTIVGIGIAAASSASDHNNIEAGRPLRFDDAYSIAFRERAFEFGLSVDTFKRREPTSGAKTELKYGFAKNQDIAVAFEPSYSSSERQGDIGNIEIGYFHGLRREIDDSPALAYRVDVGLPTGRDSKGLDLRLRGIATKALGQYDKLHLNLDVHVSTGPDQNERRSSFAAILGYSSPLGYPRSFDKTVVAEFALIQGKNRGEGYTGSFGIGLRHQIDPRSVFDMGVTTDLFAARGAVRSPLRLAFGYSVGF
jgi:hypothetical protein